MTLADTIAAKGRPDDFWLAEALSNAVEFPDDTAIWGIKTDLNDNDDRTENGDWQPILVNWARLREDRPSVRGVLTTLAPAAPQPPARLTAAVPPLSTVVQPPAVPQIIALPIAQVAINPLRPLLVSGWLLLAIMLGTLIWLMIAPCGMRAWPFGTCAQPVSAALKPLQDRRALLADIAGLESRLSQQALSCKMAEAAPPTAPQQSVLPKVNGTLDKAELDKRVADHGLTPGAALTISLVWSGLDDLDLILRCPTGDVVGFQNKTVPNCNVVLDIDANFPASSAVNDPVENISVATPKAGHYIVTVHRSADRPPLGPASFRLFVQQEGAAPRTMDGTLALQGDSWTYDLEIAIP